MFRLNKLAVSKMLRDTYFVAFETFFTNDDISLANELLIWILDNGSLGLDVIKWNEGELNWAEQNGGYVVKSIDG